MTTASTSRDADGTTSITRATGSSRDADLVVDGRASPRCRRPRDVEQCRRFPGWLRDGLGTVESRRLKLLCRPFVARSPCRPARREQLVNALRGYSIHGRPTPAIVRTRDALPRRPSAGRFRCGRFRAARVRRSSTRRSGRPSFLAGRRSLPRSWRWGVVGRGGVACGVVGWWVLLVENFHRECSLPGSAALPRIAPLLPRDRDRGHSRLQLEVEAAVLGLYCYDDRTFVIA